MGLGRAPGTRSKRAIRLSIWRKQHRFARCIDAHPVVSNQTSGTFVVRLLIGQEGSVRKTAVDFSRFPNKESRECIARVAQELERATFPIQEMSVLLDVSFTASTR